MKILLSPHLDTVKYPYVFGYMNGIHYGLLDNMIGVIASYLVVYNNPSLLKLSQEGEIGIWHNWHEEFGLMPTLDIDKDSIIIVVDVASGEQYRGKDFSIENISGFSKEEMENLKESLEWEKYDFLFKKFDGAPDDEDEAWKWREKGNKVISFIIPIDSDEDNWHGEKSLLKSSYLQKAVQGLVRTINYLL